MPGQSKKLTVEDLAVENQRVLIRADFNVPLDDQGRVTDDTRIRETLLTIRYLVEHKAKVILVSHLGRPDGKPSNKLRMAPVSVKLEEILGQKVIQVETVVGPEARTAARELKPGQVLMLENVRFHREEEANDENFSRELASLASLYVNDAFGTAHRAHASTVGVTKYVSKAAAGFLMAKELKYLDMAIHNPKRPFTVILGGAKVSSKISIITRLAEKADNILIGGGMAYTFLRAMNMSVGKSLVEEDRIKDAKEILKLLIDKNVKWLLPFDHIVTEHVSPHAVPRIVTREGIAEKMQAVDIGPNTVEMFGNVLSKSKTIMWNGPMGIFEMLQFAQGTYRIALWIADCQATSIVGGGDSIAAINRLGIAHKFTHISTGGGATLAYIEGATLPGIEALTDR